MQIKLFIRFLINWFQDIKVIQKHQWKEVNLVFDLVQMIYYKCHEINFRFGGWYIDSPDWIKKKKSNN